MIMGNLPKFKPKDRLDIISFLRTSSTPTHIQPSKKRNFKRKALKLAKIDVIMKFYTNGTLKTFICSHESERKLAIAKSLLLPVHIENA